MSSPDTKCVFETIRYDDMLGIALGSVPPAIWKRYFLRTVTRFIRLAPSSEAEGVVCAFVSNPKSTGLILRHPKRKKLFTAVSRTGRNPVLTQSSHTGRLPFAVNLVVDSSAGEGPCVGFAPFELRTIRAKMCNGYLASSLSVVQTALFVRDTQMSTGGGNQKKRERFAEAVPPTKQRIDRVVRDLIGVRGDADLSRFIDTTKGTTPVFVYASINENDDTIKDRDDFGSPEFHYTVTFVDDDKLLASASELTGLSASIRYMQDAVYNIQGMRYYALTGAIPLALKPMDIGGVGTNTQFARLDFMPMVSQLCEIHKLTAIPRHLRSDIAKLVTCLSLDGACLPEGENVLVVQNMSTGHHHNKSVVIHTVSHDDDDDARILLWTGCTENAGVSSFFVVDRFWDTIRAVWGDNPANHPRLSVFVGHDLNRPILVHAQEVAHDFPNTPEEPGPGVGDKRLDRPYTQDPFAEDLAGIEGLLPQPGTIFDDDLAEMSC